MAVFSFDPIFFSLATRKNMTIIFFLFHLNFSLKTSQIFCAPFRTINFFMQNLVTGMQKKQQPLKHRRTGEN